MTSCRHLWIVMYSVNANACTRTTPKHPLKLSWQEGKTGREERTDIQTFFSALYCFLRSFSRRSLFSPCVLSSCASCHHNMRMTPWI